jgi:hypothetical protein
MADDAEKPGQLNHLKVRRWKIAIPVAVVGAIAAPFVFGTWKMPQTSESEARHLHAEHRELSDL